MRELEVVRQVRASLLRNGLAGQRVIDLYTDAHPTLRIDPALQPFQRFALLLDGMTVHPDLVGRLDDGETTFAIEAKRSCSYRACSPLHEHHSRIPQSTPFIASSGTATKIDNQSRGVRWPRCRSAGSILRRPSRSLTLHTPYL